MKKESKASKLRPIRNEQPEQRESFDLFLDGNSVVLISSSPINQVKFSRDEAMAFAAALQDLAGRIPVKSKLILH